MTTAFKVLARHLNSPVTLLKLTHHLERSSDVMIFEYTDIIMLNRYLIIHVD